MKKQFELNKRGIKGGKDTGENLQALFGGVGKLGSMAGGGIAALAKGTASGVTHIAGGVRRASTSSTAREPEIRIERVESKMSE